MMNLFFSNHPELGYVFIGLLSLMIGSFLNVVIYRLPLTLISNDPHLNLCFPRSFCPHCKQQIPAWHNIPLLSYLILRGKCHACRESISYQYPLVELITVLSSLYICVAFGFTPLLFALLPLTWILICLTVIDLQHQLLPDSLTLGLLWLGLICNAVYPLISLQNAVLSAAGGYLFLWFFMKLFYIVTGKIGMGHGDFKLFAALGAWLGWTQLPVILMISSIVGSIVGLIYLKTQHKTKETPLPFGPFLCISGFISLLYGDKILDVYLALI
ncbi:MAG: prepilin peptidase [Legionellaceae bacterium]